MNTRPSARRRIAARTVQVLVAAAVVASGTTADLWTLPAYGVGILVVPPVLGRVLRVRLDPFQRLWVTLGLAVHPLGVVQDLYHAVGWYDNLAHAASASLVAGAVYLLLVGLAAHGSPRRVGPRVHLAALLTVLAVGVGWELFELQVAYLVVPGPVDTATDLLFDVVGWLAVAAGWESMLRGLPRQVAVRSPATADPSAPALPAGSEG